MRKIQKEKKKVEVEKEVIVSNTLHCDICDKEIKGGHWLLFMSHNVNPFVGKDICSKECLTKKLDEYVKNTYYGVTFEVSYIAGEEKPKPEEGGPKPK